MPLVDTLDLGSPTVRVIVNPGNGCRIDLTVPVGDEAGTWTGFVYATEARAAALVTFSQAVVGQTISFTLTAAQVTSLMPVGRPRFAGYYELKHVGTERTWLDGPFIVSAGFEL